MNLHKYVKEFADDRIGLDAVRAKFEAGLSQLAKKGPDYQMLYDEIIKAVKKELKMDLSFLRQEITTYLEYHDFFQQDFENFSIGRCFNF